MGGIKKVRRREGSETQMTKTSTPLIVNAIVLLFSLSYSTLCHSDTLSVSCGEQPAACLQSINKQQQRLASGSDDWWELEVTKLHSLFKFQKIDDLYVALRPWINNPDVPPQYQPHIALIYGKWLQRRRRLDEANVALEQALEGFKALEDKNASAQLELKILNTLVLLNRFEQAKTYVEQLEQKAYDSPLFYREVYAELAHIAHKNDARQAHVEYRRESVRWAKQVPDEQQKAIAYNNYGVALRLNGDYKQAEQALLKAAEHAEQAHDLHQLQKIRLRLGEIYVLLGEPQKAQHYVDIIDLQHLNKSQVAHYRNLARSVKM